MATLPQREQQILFAHAELIRQVVKAAQNRQLQAQLESVLQASEHNGWVALVATIRSILAGQRSEALLAGLDDEDRIIVEAILTGLQSPEYLKTLDSEPDPAMAAPGLAGMIDAAARGNTEALQLVGNMAEQLQQVGGDMARLGGIFRRLINGERNPDILCKGMGAQGEQLVLSILEELGRLSVH